MRSQSGFTLIQTILSVGITAAFMGGLLLTLLHSMRGVKSIERSSDSMDLVEETRIALANIADCTSNLQGTPITTANPNGSSVAKISYYNGAGVLQRDLVVAGGSYRGVNAENIILRPKAQIRPNEMIAELVFQLRKQGDGQGNLGPSGLTRSLPIFVRTQSNQVQECTSVFNLNADSLGVGAKDQICVISSDGENYYDPATDSCKSRYERQCFPGTVSNASCGSGWELEECQATYPAGFSDDFPESRRNYADGQSRTTRPDPAIYNMDTGAGTCGCIYAVGVSSAGFTCQACCRRLVVPF